MNPENPENQNQDLFSELENIKDQLGDYVIAGSGPLGVRNMRKMSDLDILVNKEKFCELLQSGMPLEDGRKDAIRIGNISIFYDWPGLSDNELKKVFETREIINGLPFANLKETTKMKFSQTRPFVSGEQREKEIAKDRKDSGMLFNRTLNTKTKDRVEFGLPETREVLVELEKISPNAEKAIRFNPTLVNDISLAFREGSLIGEDKKFISEEMSVIVEEIKSLLKRADEERLNPYHNKQHALEVNERFSQLLEVEGLTEQYGQLGDVASLFHDFRHAGTTKREAADGMSNEEMAALEADKFAKEKGFSVRQRVIISSLIIGTTFGNPEVSTTTDLENLLSLADVGGFIKSWDDWVKECADVLTEMPMGLRPTTIEGWLKTRVGFLKFFIQPKMTEAAKRIWGQALTEKIGIVENLLANPDQPEMTVVKEKIEALLRKE